jgi:hypothetical protein
MRIISTVLATGLLFSVAAHAHGGPCMNYVKTCKADPSVSGATDKRAAMEACVSGAAAKDTTNGEKCMQWQAKHHAEHDGHQPASE